MIPRWVIVVAVTVLGATCVPLAYRAATTPPDQYFTGNCEQVCDQSTNLMWARQVRDGHLLAHDLHTSEPHPPVLPSLPWLAVGLVARALHLPLLWAYHGVRVLFGLAYLLLAWGLVAEYLPGSAERAFAWIAIALGSGLAILAGPINDIAGRQVAGTAEWMPELWGFHSIAVQPHFALALALIAGLVWVLLASYRRVREIGAAGQPARPGRGVWKLALAAAGLAALLTLVHPFDIVVWGPLLVAHTVGCRLWGGRRVHWANVAALVGVAPAAGFLLWQMRTNPVFEAWARQNLLLSPSMLAYLAGFGVVVVLAISGLVILGHRRQRTAADWLIIGWVAITAVMVNSGPVISFERRCIEGLHIPLSLLAAIGITGWLMPWLQRRWHLGQRRAGQVAMAALLVCILPTNIRLLADASVSREALIPTDWVEAFGWLAHNTAPQDCVLASPLVGNHLAWLAVRPVYVGHTQLTIDFERKAEQVERFFDARTPAARREKLLAESGCRWVMAQNSERQSADELPDLQRVYSNATVSIYRVR